MVLGYERLNTKRSPPNEFIAFIKPLKGPDEATAQDFLERIAAQCYPIMKEFGLRVVSLEEYEPNREFLGRNFNAGEVIQLVLKSRDSGRWFPFDFVQMVMMHELAHCKEMNHSKAFWAVRNVYADWMRQLWARGYTGEGLWGRGRHLGTGKFTVNTTLPEEPLPKHLCGGTYESRGSRRHHRTKTTKEPLTYQQRKERRILNKFGANGVTLGSDPSTKVKLENGRLIKAAPRVAQSARGRELRAAAAIARFEQQKEEEARALEWFKKQKEESDARSSESGSSKGKEPAKRAERYDDDDSSTQSDYDEDDNGIVDSRAAAIDIDGSAMTDKDGKDLVRVCGDEEFGSDAVQETRDELRELQSSIREFFKPLAGPAGGDKKRKPELSASTAASSSGVGSRAPPTAPSQPTPAAARSPRSPEPKRTRAGSPILISSSSPSPATKQPPPPGSGSAPVLRLRTRGQMVPEPLPAPDIPKLSCPVCSFENELTDVACGACGNVLDPDGMPGAWRCGSEYCRKTQSQYVHARDVEACVVCGRVA